MPTIKPRFSITMDWDDLAILDRFAAAAGRPRAAFVSEMISAACPEFERAAGLLEAANAAPADVLRNVIQEMSDATDHALSSLENTVDMSSSAINKAMGKPPRRVEKQVRVRGRSGTGRTPTY